MKTQLRADLLLIVVTMAWGVSYFVMDIALTETTPFTLNAMRFLGAFLAAGAILFKEIRHVSRATLQYSLLVGTALTFVYIGSTFGVKYTTISNAGFLCGMTVLFVPVLAFLFLRRKPQKKMLLVAAASFAGIMLLTLKDDFSVNMEHLRGDLFCILCSFSYAADLLITEKAVACKEVNALHLGVFQLGVCGVLMLLLGLFFEDMSFPQSRAVWGSVLFLAVFSTGICYIAQTIAQQYTSAAHVGIIFTMEPVFASLSAFFLAGEVMTAKSYLGAAIIVASLIISEVDFKKRKEEGNENTA